MDNQFIDKSDITTQQQFNSKITYYFYAQDFFITAIITIFVIVKDFDDLIAIDNSIM